MTNFLVEQFKDGWNPVDIAYARYLRNTTEHSDIARIARELTCKRVLGEGVHFDLTHQDDSANSKLTDITSAQDSSPSEMLSKHAGKKHKTKQSGDGTNSISLDDIFSSVRVEWNEFVEKLDIEIMRQGFSLITMVPSRYNPAVYIPHIEDIAYYELFYRYIPRRGIEYAAVWSNLERFQESDDIKNNHRITNSKLLVACGCEPSENGKLRSKLADAAPLISEMEAMEENISYALYWSAHPVYVPQLSPTGPGTLKGNASAAAASISSPPYANYTQLMQDQTAVARFARAQKLDDAEQVAEDAYRRHLAHQVERRHEQISFYQRQMAHNNRKAATAIDGNARHAVHPPYSVDYPMEQGDTIAAGPSPSLPAQIREHKNDLSRRAFLALDVQPQLVTLEHSNHAANSDIAFAGQNDAIKNRQSILEPLIAEAFRFVYDMDLRGVDSILANKKETKVDGKPVVQHSAGISCSHRIRARLCNVPLTTFDALEKMLQTKVIDHSTYRDMMLQTASVSSHLASSDTVTSEQIDEWYRAKTPEKENKSSGSSKRKSATGKAK